ncbi:MAG: hypothetical protein JWP12_2993 [Bacteroidetes bacterium]|nr:hypothetical protein [Bacteroidota bacterium]
MQEHILIDKSGSLGRKVEQTVLQFPEANALFINDRFYTYRQFWNVVKNVYAQIPQTTVFSRIGIYCNDDVYTYAAIIAVNLYGAAYVPLNKKYPVERTKIIAQESGLELLLISAESADVKAIAGNFKIINIGKAAEKPSSTIDLEKINTNNRTGYILFTSGSTASPKGVPVLNENINSFFNYYLANYNFNECDRFLQVYELTFDVSVFSFFMPLLAGACCYVLPDTGIKFLKTVEYLEQHKITVVSMVPGVLTYLEKYLTEIRLPELRYSFFSGDALYHSLAVKWNRSVTNAVIHNFYGPTETTIVCTRYIFDEEQSAKESVNGIVPLGKAFEGMEFLIVDEDNKQVEKGELCFAGTQVIPGYLNDAYEEQFFNYKEKRYYKTGDVAAVNEYGNLVFYGRTDDQVKINGYRVELKEVGAAIEKVSGAACTVLAIKDQHERNILCAFLVLNEINKAELTAALSAVLPGYMIPQEFIAVAEFPLNLNGKIDKNKLIHLHK